jgi:transcription antitermination factor NusG
MFSDTKANWYTAYTFPNTEKKVHSELSRQNILSYLPVQQVVRQWSDRKKKLIVPLFPSYIFINTDQKRKFDLLNIKGILRFVSFERKLAIVTDEEIASIKKVENAEFEIEPHLVDGDNVIITYGPFTGLKGKLFNKLGKRRFGLRINALNQSLSIDILASFVKKI